MSKNLNVAKPAPVAPVEKRIDDAPPVQQAPEFIAAALASYAYSEPVKLEPLADALAEFGASAGQRANGKASKGKTAVASQPGALRETVRVRALRFIQRNGPSTATQTQVGIGLSHSLKPTLDQEVGRGNLKYTASNSLHGALTYAITPVGVKSLADGSVLPRVERRLPVAKLLSPVGKVDFDMTARMSSCSAK